MVYQEAVYMATNYLEIESTSGLNQAVKQSLKFKTGNFVWRVRFNTALDPQTINNSNLTISSSGGKQIKTNITYNSLENEIEIEPLEPYAKEETYTLHISKRVTTKGGRPLKETVDVQFRL